nr:hypothetical protein [Tanacetum cinerariifolium]
MLLYSWDKGLDVCVDLTGSSHLTQTETVDFIPGRAVIDAAQRKRGELETNAVILLKQIHKFSITQDIELQSAGLQAKLLRDSNIVTYGPAFDNALIGKEVDIGLSGGRDKPLRLANMLLCSWGGGFDVCVDLTGSSPLTQTGMIDFVPGRAVIEAAQRKRVKYEAKCAYIRYDFFPFSFSSFGELEKDAVTLLKRI